MNSIQKKYVFHGHSAFLLSGLCSISSGIIVSLLQEKYGFSYSFSGILLSIMSIGNMAACFVSGILPEKIGQKKSVAVLCSGYFSGYLLMAFFGSPGILAAAFLLTGIAKGSAINNCTVLVGNNSVNRTKALSLMHACYATGAMVCPFVITAFMYVNRNLPMSGIAFCGLLMWLVFMTAGLSEKASDSSKKGESDFSFLKSTRFWLLCSLIFCQNAAETAVTGWLVSYYKGNGILSGNLSTYTITVMWASTLVVRLMIAFVFPVKNAFKATAIMGLGCSFMYFGLICAKSPVPAVLMLIGFSAFMAGVNPIGVAGVGSQLSGKSMAVLLPVAGLGQIIMPYLIGVIADSSSLQTGMMINVIPCAGIFIISRIIPKFL
ncbi:MAG: MFS transporter [Treponema sp.]|nr:MFS transporter [Treponema sp.]